MTSESPHARARWTSVSSVTSACSAVHPSTFVGKLRSTVITRAPALTQAGVTVCPRAPDPPAITTTFPFSRHRYAPFH